MKKQSPELIIQFHKETLADLIEIYQKRGLTNVDIINSFNAKGKLEDSLWKIPEAYGKNNQRYISESVKLIRDELDRLKIKRNKSSIWTNTDLKKGLSLNNKLPFEGIESYKVELEHVVEKQVLVPILINAKSRNEVFKIIDQYNLGCLVLESEHNKLPDKKFDAKDPWIRYKEAKIKVWDTLLQKFVC